MNITKSLKGWWNRQDVNRNLPEQTEPYFRGEIDGILFIRAPFTVEKVKVEKRVRTREFGFPEAVNALTIVVCSILLVIATSLVVMRP